MKYFFFYVIALTLITSCSSAEDRSETGSTIPKNYYALGASTASMPWQNKVAAQFAKEYKSFANGGATWTHSNSSVYDLSDDASGRWQNKVMTNQLARLLKYCVDTGKSPDIITIMCSLNDAAYGPILGDFDSALNADLGNVTPEEWFLDSKYKNLNKTVYGTSVFVIGSLRRNFPKAKIILLTGQQCNNGAYNNKNVNLVNEALIKVASHYKLKTIDIFNNSGIVVTDSQKSPYLSDDQIHPNKLGEQLLTDFVTKELKRILYDEKY